MCDVITCFCAMQMATITYLSCQVREFDSKDLCSTNDVLTSTCNTTPSWYCSVSCVFITYSGSGKWMIDTINHSHPRRLTGLTSSRVSITKVPMPRKSVLLYLCSVPCVSRQNINIPRQWWATLWPSDLTSHASRLTTYRVSLHQSPRIKDIWTIYQDVSTHD